MFEQIIAGLIFIFAYVLIISEKVHRTAAAAFGAMLMVVFGTIFGFFTQEDILFVIDWNTIGLLTGMMIIVGIFKVTGFFEYIAIKTAKFAKGELWKIMLTFTLLTAVISAFLDNVTTVLLISPITVQICTTLRANPVPFLIAEILASNIGGTATLIGDPPNIMIGSGAGLAFDDFILFLSPISAFILVVIIVYLKIIYREELKREAQNIEEIMNMDENAVIQDRVLLKKSLLALGLTLVLFSIHHLIGLFPSVVALIGATLLLFISFESPENILREVEWPVLAFFVGLFILVGGIEKAGIIDIAAHKTVEITGGSLFVALVVILWVSAFASSILDNIPFTATMIPLIHEMANDPIIAPQLAEYHINPLWWALALGACLGGNGTLIGASANVVVAGISERMGHPISFKEFTKVGLPSMIISIIIATIILFIFIKIRWGV
jgi:Na+/H+ antiporter NhaD/arsenite permease-like protein